MTTESATRHLDAGETLFREGDAGHEAYVVESGNIECYQQLPTGAMRHAGLAGPGELCGEHALLGETHRNTTAVATEPTVVRPLDDDWLSQLLAQTDPVVRRLLLAAFEHCDTLLQRAQPAHVATPSVITPDADATELPSLSPDLSQALAGNEFRLHFQPVMRLSDGGVAGFEALLRWQRPDGSLALPHEFLGRAEQAGPITAIGEWTLDTACAALRRLSDQREAGSLHEAPLFVAINLSPAQCGPATLKALTRALQHHGLRPRQVRLELGEASLVEQLDRLRAFLAGCRTLGVRLSVDNVGTGPSVLPYLHRLPVDALTLADAFVHDLAQRPDNQPVVAAICRLAADLELDTVAKGVETPQQHAAVYAAGFRYAQGFHYAAAMPLEDAAGFLQKRALSATEPALSC